MEGELSVLGTLGLLVILALGTAAVAHIDPPDDDEEEDDEEDFLLLWQDCGGEG